MKLALAFFLLTGMVHGATIAVIDSGLDYKHEMIVPNLWTNPNEVRDRRDTDGNGYQDDIHGWNFAEQNSEIIDYKYLGTFSPDCKKFFDIQGKIFLKEATEEEINWLKTKVQDKKFISEMGKFGNFIHGTHVAGISIRETNSKVMGIKLIPTEIKPFIDQALTQKTSKRWALLTQTFDALAREQMKMLTEIARFVAFHKTDVANGSFGTGFNQAKMITDNAFRLLFFRAPKEDESNRAARMFIDALVSHGQTFVAAAPNTLFVFAAGNDGSSNDDLGTSPANIKADNVISVGATYKDEFFAPFSNYGVNTVDVAAPGMLIDSAIPGNDYLQVSGTSQAAPYVAALAARIKEVNPALRPVEVKNILMGTVDKKKFLADRVASGGMVNNERALFAADLSRTVPLGTAISRANTSVKSQPSGQKSLVIPHSVMPIPMPSMFQ
jgi:cell wall-associated protease